MSVSRKWRRLRLIRCWVPGLWIGFGGCFCRAKADGCCLLLLRLPVCIGTLVIGMHGFRAGDEGISVTLKKFAEDISHLSPAAQEASAVHSGVGCLIHGLMESTRERLFAVVSAGDHGACAHLLPALQTSLNGVAGSFNTLSRLMEKQLMSPELSTRSKPLWRMCLRRCSSRLPLRLRRWLRRSPISARWVLVSYAWFGWVRLMRLRTADFIEKAKESGI